MSNNSSYAYTTVTDLNRLEELLTSYETSFVINNDVVSLKKVSSDDYHHAADPVILEQNVDQPLASSQFTAERTYPHIFDLSEKSGKALILINTALNDINDALDSFNDANLHAVSTKLNLIAVNLAKAHKEIDFNPALGAVIGFIRRAALITPIDEITRSSLNGMSSALIRVHSNPMLDLDDATDITDALASEGWKGEIALVTKLINAIISLDNDDEESTQTVLFDEKSE